MPSETSRACADPSVEKLRRELAEAREQQTATAEILRVISSSPMDLGGVFASIAASAARLCDAYDAAIHRVDGDFLAIVAHHGPIPAPSTFHLMPGLFVGRAVLKQRTIHVADVLTAADEYPEGSDRARSFFSQTGTPGLGFRTILAVPLIRAGKAIGVISIRRPEVRAFTDRQIELLRIFADQAVIAIENARLFEAEQTRTKELQESLEYQTATSEVLNVISRSPNKLQPVFDVIAKSASRLCGDEYAIVARYDGELLHLVAQHNPRPGSADETARWFPHRPAPPSVLAPAVTDNAVVHISDIEDEDLPSSALEAFRRIALRAVVTVPMIHESRAIGAIAVSRATPGAFPQRQINLLRTFADQAVIAIENARLFEAEQASKREMNEALEQQTATSPVLEVISSSPGELERVFQTMLENAVRICGAKFGAMHLYGENTFRTVAMHNMPPAFAEMRRSNPSFSPSPATALGRAVRSGQPVQIPDLTKSNTYREGEPASVQMAELAGARTLLVVPMVKEDQALGTIAIYRQEVRLFTDEQIKLVSNFAKQAVIAIENTQLLNELRESLQQQTATADVLSVISSSPGELRPVFQAMLANAVKLCEAKLGALFRYDAGAFQAAASLGVPREYD